MSISYHDQPELFELLERLCENCLSDKDAARLEQLVLTSPERMELYLSYVDLHGTLHWDTARTTARVTGLPPVEASEASSRRAVLSLAPPLNVRRHVRTALAVSVCLLLGVLSLVAWRWSGTDQVAESPVANPAPQPAEKTRTSPGTDAVVELRNLDTFEFPQPRRSTDPEAMIPEGPPAVDPVVPEYEAPLDGGVVAFIDEELEREWEARELSPSPTADDAEWIRRVYLDVTGRIPRVEDVERFLADVRPYKRQRLVDELLDEPDYVYNFTTIWSNLLVGRSDNPDIDRQALESYLRDAFRRNRPWKDTVYELVSAEGDPSENGAANFLLAHLNNQAVPATAITARLFMGVQIQCTQCHKHPFNDTTQQAFWELNSFFKQTERVVQKTYDQRDGRMKSRVELVSREVGGPTFYENRQGLVRVAYPIFAGTQIPDQAEVNRREQLARLMTGGEKPLIAEAMVNRMWAHFFGFGFTHSITDMGPHAIPSHPRLLEELARRFVESNYDLKQLIRWICASQAYQLTSRIADNNTDDQPEVGDVPAFSRMYLKSMSPEQIYDSLLVAASTTRAQGNQRLVSIQDRNEWIQQFVIDLQTEENDEQMVLDDGTVTQALLRMNGELVEAALDPTAPTLIRSILNDDMSDSQAVRRLSLAALSREPTPQEATAFRKVLSSPRGSGRRQARTQALQDIFWAYLNSPEFVLIH